MEPVQTAIMAGATMIAVIIGIWGGLIGYHIKIVADQLLRIADALEKEPGK